MRALAHLSRFQFLIVTGVAALVVAGTSSALVKADLQSEEEPPGAQTATPSVVVAQGVTLAGRPWYAKTYNNGRGDLCVDIGVEVNGRVQYAGACYDPSDIDGGNAIRRLYDTDRVAFGYVGAASAVSGGIVAIVLNNGTTTTTRTIADTGVYVVPVPADPVAVNFTGASGAQWSHPYLG